MSDSSPSSHRFWIACFIALQLIALCTALVFIAAGPGILFPWPRVMVLGTLLSQCLLAAAWAVMGNWRLALRMACSAGTVTFAILAIGAAEELPRLENTVIIELFALTLWAIIPVPFWLARLSLGARVVQSAHRPKPRRIEHNMGFAN
jgi:hypothetical protein